MDKLVVIKVTSRNQRYMANLKEWRKSIAVLNVSGAKDALETAQRLVKPFTKEDLFDGSEFSTIRMKVREEGMDSLEFYHATELDWDLLNKTYNTSESPA